MCPAFRRRIPAIAARKADRAVRIMREHLYEFAARAERAREELDGGAAAPGSS